MLRQVPKMMVRPIMVARLMRSSQWRVEMFAIVFVKHSMIIMSGENELKLTGGARHAPPPRDRLG